MADDSEKLLMRSKVIYDGAIPAGNSVAAMNLLRLAAMTANLDYSARAQQLIKAISVPVIQYPAGHAQLMSALEFAFNPIFEVVVDQMLDNLRQDIDS